MFKYITYLLLIVGMFALSGCESLDALLNGDADDKMSQDDTLTPSQHGVLSQTKTSPTGINQQALQSLRDIEDSELVKYGSAEKGDSILNFQDTTPTEEPSTFDIYNSTNFATVFPTRNADERMKLSLTADNLNISGIVAKFASDLKFNYTIESGVSGTITMSLNGEMALVEVWDLFQQLLWMCDSYCEYKNGILFIRPLSSVAKTQNLMDKNSTVVLHTVRMKYVSAASILEQITPFLTSEATAKVLSQSNSIVLIDTAENIARLTGIINELDRNYKSGWYRVVLPCAEVSASTIKDELKQILPVLGIPVVEGTSVDIQAGAIHLTSMDRLQVIVASASAIEPLKEVRKWVESLSMLKDVDKTNAYVYNVVNSDASNLLTELSVLFPNLVGLVINDGSTKTVNGIAANSASELDMSPDNIFTYPVRIAATMEYNRLLIMSSPKVYGIIRALLERLDTIPPQVLLQVMVVQIELSDENSFGMEWNAQSTIGGDTMNFGTDYLDLKPGDSSQYGGNIHIYDPSNPDSQFLYIKALAGKSKLNVVSSPQVLVRSQKQAKVSVGKEVPVLYADITDTSSTTGDSTAVQRSYQYKSTGVILTVTPTISVGGLISMEISQTISDVLSTTTDSLDTPTIKNDQITTELTLRSGRTIIMGGLISDSQEESLTSIPYLSEIPMLSWLIGDSSKSTARTEILMLITATIIDESTTLENMVKRYSDSLREINVFENNIYEPYDKRFDEAQKKGLISVDRLPAATPNSSDAEAIRLLTLDSIVGASESDGRYEEGNYVPPEPSEEMVAPMEDVPETEQITP